MSRVTSLTNMSEKQLNRLIRIVGLLLLVGVVAFVAFYVVDRYKPIQQPSQIQQQIADAEAAVQKDPADIASRGTLADLYLADKRYQDAVDQYSAIIQTGKDEELARIGRARAYESLSQPDLAAQDWQRVVDIAAGGEMAGTDTNLSLAYYRLGMIDYNKGDAAGAIDQLKKSLAISQTDSDTLLALGDAYAKAGQTDNAIDAYTKASDFVPVGWADPYKGLAAVYTQKGDAAMTTWANAMVALSNGDYTTAEAQLKPLLGGSADLAASMGMGLLWEAKGEGQNAVPYYQHIIDKDPTNSEAALGLARVRPVQTASPAASPAASASQGG